jgi:5-methyltetrahydrofolate--homocysteine methyltransferase
MNQALYDGDAATVKEMTETGLQRGISAPELLGDGLVAGMAVVGEDFKHNRIYLPEVLVAARAMKAGMEILQPLLAAHDSGVEPVGTVVMGTVKGDLHDIGKNIVCMLCEGAGFQVVNIGVDQSADNFLAAAREHHADIVGCSALLTTTMKHMRTVVSTFAEAQMDHVSICVGGAPVTQQYCDDIGAQGYAPNASVAVELFKSLVEAPVAAAAEAVAQ